MADNEKTEAVEQTAEDAGFAEAFAERAENPAGERQEAGAEAEEASATKEPADEAGSDEAPAPAAAEDNASGTAQKADPWDGLTPEQRQMVERLQAADRSQRGRVAALTKKVQRYESEGPKPEPKPDPEKTEASDDAGTASDLESRFKSTVEEYSDVLGPAAEVIEELRKEITELKASDNRTKQVDANSDEAEAEAMAKAYDQLGQAHPDYQQIGASPEFAEWAGKQPKKVQELITSYDPAEVSLSLTLYKAEAGLLSKQPGEQSGGDGSTAQDEKRARQLEGSRQPEVRGAPAASGVPNDFKSAFKARAKQTA